MANRIKEDDKNEKIIRGLLKLPENKRCINCNSLGPQYVCTNFWTFICTNCSGIHREFTHRVKSVSMAKFTSQEVASLQGGGNERARQIYFKEWDPQRNSFPDGSNIDRLREFIRHVYVDRRYSGARSADRPQRTKSDTEEYNDNQRTESYRGGSRSPPYEDRYGDRPGSGGRNDDQNFRYNYGDRGPGYDRVDYKTSPARPEVADARPNVKYGNGNQSQRSEGRRVPDVPKPEGRLPDHPKDAGGISPPMIRPVRDILGDEVPQLQVGEPSNLNGKISSNSIAQTKNNSPSSNLGSSDVNSTANLGSLIDFSAEPGPSNAAVSQQSIPQQTDSSGGDWASFDMSGQQKVSQVARSANTLESALAGLSISGSAPAGNMQTPPISGIDASPKANGAGQVTAVQHQQTSFFPIDNLSGNQPSNALVGASNNQAVGLSSEPYLQGSLPPQAVASFGHLSRISTKPPQGVADGSSSQPNSAENKSSGRKELPVDLFTSLYPSAPMQAQGWHRGPFFPMGYGVQYPTGMVAAAFSQSQSPKSVNPFDFNSEPAATFPSMTTTQGILSNLTASATMQQNSSSGAAPPRWLPPQQYSYAPSGSPSPFVMQEVPSYSHQQLLNNMMPIGHSGVASSGTNGPALGTPGIDQQSAARFSVPNTPSAFGSVGGNPFG